MEPIPDNWPPEAVAGKHATVPLFPLPGVFLFPRLPLPLQIFEPRYLQMIEDCLDGPGRIVIGTIVESEHQDLSGSPSVLPMAGLGEIAKHERLPDGRYIIWLVGLARVRVQEVASDRMYRKVEFEVVPEIPSTAEDAERLAPPLSEAILSRAQHLLNLPDDAPIDLLTDLLLQTMALPQTVMESIYCEYNATNRAEKALEAHARFPSEK